MGNIKPRDIIALCALILVVIMKFTGNDGAIEEFIAGIVGFYMGNRQSDSNASQ